ncbi:MAG: DUF4124 domain-containing protein [Desulfobacteraceae bacterium]|jgi:hypothetical protein|nr:MAG: DUF4124 domain-containing protein [Desulfobacteraceae bacterium]
MFRQKAFTFLLLSGIIILWTIIFLLFPLQSESGEVYSYTDENGVVVITNTPLPDKIRNKAKKIGSYKDITDKDMIQPKTDEKGKQGQDSDKKRSEAGEKTATDAELLDKMKKSDAETDKFVKSVKESKNKAADVLNTLAPLRKFP